MLEMNKLLLMILQKIFQNLSEKYEELNKKKNYNNKIDRAIAYTDDYNNKIKSLDNELDKKILQINGSKESEKYNKETDIASLKHKIELIEKEIENLDNEYQVYIDKAQAEHDMEVAKLDENIKVANEWAFKSKENTEILENELKIAEEMKGHINEYDRMEEKQSHIETLVAQSKILTDKIELARNLPGQILKEVEIPVKNLTVENGIPLVNSLPVRKFKRTEKNCNYVLMLH